MHISKSNLIIYLVATTFFMENLDGTVIATALPEMGNDFGVNAVDVSIGMTAYLLTLAILIPISGWLADRFGSRAIFTTAIAIFTLASIMCGLSTNLWFFTAARILQGIGGALMVPVGRATVLRSTNKENLINAISLITWPGLVAPVVGPAIGGFLTTYASWRWIFFLNVPLGIVGIAFSLWLLKNDQAIEKKPFDTLGFILSGITISGLMYTFELGRHLTGSYIEACIVWGVSSIFGLLTFFHLQRSPHPLIDLSLLQIPTLSASVWAGSIFRIVLTAVPFLSPLLFQLGFGLDPFDSGLLVLSIFVGNLAMKSITTPILNRYGFRNVMLLNGGLIVLSIYSCSLISPALSFSLIAVTLFFNGAVRSLQFTSLNVIGFSDVPKSKMNSASSMISTVMQLSNALGIAFGSLALSISVFIRNGAIGSPSIADFHSAFLYLAALAVVGILLLMRLDSDAGSLLRKSPVNLKVGNKRG